MHGGITQSRTCPYPAHIHTGGGTHMRFIVVHLIIASCFFAWLPSVYAAPSTLEDLVTKKTKELLKNYRGPKDLSIAIVDTDKTAISAKITTLMYKIVFNDGRFSIVERELMNQLTKELELQQTGLMKIASRIGQMTGADLILLVRREENDMRLRIVSVEKGVILAYNFIPLAEIAEAESGARTGTAHRPVYGGTYHSPVIAGLVSIFPVWSGSWNAGWTEWGMALVVGKTGSWAPVLVFWWQGNTKKKKLDDFNKKANNFFSAYPSARTESNLVLYLVWKDRLQGKYDRARDSYKKSLMYCSITWAGLTAADIIGSVIYVISRNPQYGGGVWGKESLHLSCSLESRMDYSTPGDMNPRVPDGLDLAVSYHY